MGELVESGGCFEACEPENLPLEEFVAADVIPSYWVFSKS